MSHIYRAYLTREAGGPFFGRFVDGPTLSALSDGFWITEDHKFTQGEAAVFWLPSSRIEYIEKVELEDEQ